MRLFVSCLFTLALFAACCAASDAPASVSGTVRDGDGKPVADVKVSLTSDQIIPPTTIATTSDREGKYHFAGVLPGKYHIAAKMSGFAATADRALEVPGSSNRDAIDFTLTPVSAGPARPPLKFQAAGVRGLIDPGGYSAPADAAAASGLIRGIADIKRSGGDYGAINIKDWPCGIEPELNGAAAANPGQGEANRRLGEFYLAHHQIATAISFLKQAREIDGSDDLASRDLAVAWMMSGRFDSARELLTPLAENLRAPEAHRLLARADEGSGMFPQASQQYQLAAKDDPSEENLFGVGYELILAGSPAAAAAAFQSGLKQHPKSVRLLLGSGAAQFLQGHTAEGILAILEVSDLSPSDPRPYSFLASAAGVSQAEAERVQNAFKRFFDLAPNNPEAVYFYALSLPADTTESAAKIGLLKRVIVLNPNLAKAHLELGRQYELGGQYKEAAAEYEITLRLAPDLKEVHYRLARVYRQTSQSDLATQEIETFQQLRDREASQTADSTSDIRQFISALDAPEAMASPQTECPQTTP